MFNVGERVEVDSDPLWMGTLAAPARHNARGVPRVDLGGARPVHGRRLLPGGLAVVRLGARHDEGTVLPIGLLMVSVVAGVWQFATSGLEMSMVFLPLGLSLYLLLVRVGTRRSACAARRRGGRARHR